MSYQLSHAGDVTVPAASRLVLSLFPGAGLLDRGFERAGFCVVRGPDTVFGQRIEEFRAPAGHFIGVIGGPPCQDFSRARRAPPTGHGIKMLKEFGRVVTEAAPLWWLMENVPQVPSLVVHGYEVQRFNLNATECGMKQSRLRCFQFGSRDGIPLVVLRRAQSHFGRWSETITTKHGHRNFADLCELQGLPRNFHLSGLSRTAQIRAVANGVPVPMAEAVAVAIRDRRVTDLRKCACGCGRVLYGYRRQKTATPACRKRIERSRRGDTPGTITVGPPVASFLPDAPRHQTHGRESCAGTGPVASLGQ
jgi:DNA (cytosine-5)-methyltransferase 1